MSGQGVNLTKSAVSFSPCVDERLARKLSRILGVRRQGETWTGFSFLKVPTFPLLYKVKISSTGDNIVQANLPNLEPNPLGLSYLETCAFQNQTTGRSLVMSIPAC